jgi:hypothetical protein
MHMISSFAIRAVTVGVFFFGFAVGWWWRGRRDRELAAQLFEASARKTDRNH